MLIYNDKQSTANEIKEALEGSDTEQKILAMQKAIVLLLNGEQLPQLFITIVRYVLPSEDHTVQKLLLLYLVRALVAAAEQEHPARLQQTAVILTSCFCLDLAGSN
jgi:vesicle coat complex subunit